MKNIKQIVLAIFMVVAVTSFAGIEKAVISTSAQCDMCKTKIEASLVDMDGVKKVMLDVDSKELKVKYDEDVVSLDEIKATVASIGYTADDVKPTKEAVAALDKCCQPKKGCCAAGAAKSSCSKSK